MSPLFRTLLAIPRTVMESCSFDGNADLCCLGVRIGFYLQWTTTITANFVLSKEEIVASGFALALYIIAVFLNLMVQTFRFTINPLDVYVTNLLCFGSQFLLVPLFLWRILTCGNPVFDPTRWMVVDAVPPLKKLTVVLCTASSAFQLWFWIRFLPREEQNGCQIYGFLFVKAPLNNPMLRDVNIALLCLQELIVLLGWIEYQVRKGQRPYLETKMVR